MMENLSFEHLLEVYKRMVIEDDREGTLTLNDDNIVSIVKLVTKEENHSAAQISLLEGEDSDIVLGRTLRLHLAAPKKSLGWLVNDFDALLKVDGALLRQPDNYFIIGPKISSKDHPPQSLQIRYRQMISVMELVAEAAAYVDKTRQEMVFVTDSKVAIPLRLSERQMLDINLSDVAKLCAVFSDSMHKDQKLAILSQAVVKLVASQKPQSRLAYLLRNLDAIVEEVANGYRLFASSFSYSKIKGEMEAARVDLIGKIHKTIVDIQGQLLGIPVATIVVATQLKEAPNCGLPFWSNTAVIFGAWVFIALLTVAIINQYLTLTVIEQDVSRQQTKLRNEFAALGDSITTAFDNLQWRITYHKIALVVIAVVAIGAACIATASYSYLNGKSVISCIAG
ncbi:hypothetical protein [Agrobacterium sp. NPDC090273]|uniref:hypothetical protein n=1 Tax=Agrobacterium sp. NPDC090273 TaxID=3363919 RepID=UPI00383A3CD8